MGWINLTWVLTAAWLSFYLVLEDFPCTIPDRSLPRCLRIRIISLFQLSPDALSSLTRKPTCTLLSTVITFLKPCLWTSRASLSTRFRKHNELTCILNPFPCSPLLSTLLLTLSLSPALQSFHASTDVLSFVFWHAWVKITLEKFHFTFLPFNFAMFFLLVLIYFSSERSILFPYLVFLP